MRSASRTEQAVTEGRNPVAEKAAWVDAIIPVAQKNLPNMKMEVVGTVAALGGRHRRDRRAVGDRAQRRRHRVHDVRARSASASGARWASAT